jgi:hypothetical protein
MGQKLVRFAGLSGTRSCQDASMEVHEVGWKRPSSGCNGDHVLSLYPLIWRSLSSTKSLPPSSRETRVCRKSCSGHSSCGDRQASKEFVLPQTTPETAKSPRERGLHI